MKDDILMLSETDHKLYNIKDYVTLNKLGHGSFGKVYLAKNKINNTLYALKKLTIGEHGHSKQTIREIGLLKILQHPNIITLFQVIMTDSKCYIVLEYMKMSLDVFIREKIISIDLRNSFMFQLLQGLAFCHNRGVMHRDIKPQNILVSHTETVVKLSDFGLGRKINYSKVPNLTPHVVTLFYRPPELLLRTRETLLAYSFYIDMWSMGCIFVELCLKHPPFRADSELSLLVDIFRQLGVPTKHDFMDLLEFDVLLDKTGLSRVSYVGDMRNSILLYESMVSEACFDLVRKMFTYECFARITANEALRHKFFNDFNRDDVPAVDEELCTGWE